MGSPLGPVLANLFMGHLEKIWFDEFKSCEVILYICLFSCEKDANQFFTFHHPNIKFTFQKEKDKEIAFLDVGSAKPTIAFAPVCLAKVRLLAYKQIFRVLLHFCINLYRL